MKLRKLLPIVVCALCVAPALPDAKSDPAKEVLALERQAMDGWLTGNPDPQLAITDPQITYFHIMLEKPIVGLPALRDLYERYRGMALFDSYEILNPSVQTAGDVAVLSYQLARHKGADTTLWNATQVYVRRKEGWRVIHTHWSQVKPPQS